MQNRPSSRNRYENESRHRITLAQIAYRISLKKEAKVQPQLTLLATHMALTKQSSIQNWCIMEAPLQLGVCGRRLVSKYCHPKYLYDIQIVQLADVEQKKVFFILRQFVLHDVPRGAWNMETV